MTPDVLLDELTDLIAPKLVARGFLMKSRIEPTARSLAPEGYDEATCAQFLDRNHLGDAVLERATFFFGELATHGEINSLELTAGLGLKGPRSIPANLTIPLKKSAWRLGLEQPWEGDVGGPRTIWRDRDGIARRLVKAIEDERARRGLT